MNYMTHAPFIEATAVNKEGWITCPNCKQRHGLFYRRHSDSKRTLNYLCDKILRREIMKANGDMDRERLYTHMGQCEFVDGLSVKEEWTPKYRKEYEQEHHDKLI